MTFPKFLSYLQPTIFNFNKNKKIYQQFEEQDISTTVIHSDGNLLNIMTNKIDLEYFKNFSVEYLDENGKIYYLIAEHFYGFGRWIYLYADDNLSLFFTCSKY